jgi:hypothetical protein
MTEEMTWKGERIVVTPDAFAGIVEYAQEMDMRIGMFINSAIRHSGGITDELHSIPDADLLYVCAKYYYDSKNARAVTKSAFERNK